MLFVFLLADKYSALVSGEAAQHLEEFISQDSSFEEYTLVRDTLFFLRS